VDNCPSTPNANQADCDGDGIGDACDSFNGTTSDSYTYTLTGVYGPVDAFCDYDYLDQVWLGVYQEDHLHQETTCSGSTTSTHTYSTVYGYFDTLTYDPWDCGDAIAAQGSKPKNWSGKPQLAPAKDFSLVWENGLPVLVTPRGKRSLPPSALSGLLLSKGGKLYYNGPEGEHEMKRGLVQPNNPRKLQKLLQEKR